MPAARTGAAAAVASFTLISNSSPPVCPRSCPWCLTPPSASNYLVYNEGGGGSVPASGGSQFGQALVNAIVIVSVIALATFVLVLCYYLRCIKVMVGYLLFASVNLLGYSGGFMAISAVQLWQVTLDWATLAFLMYNFAIAGVVAIFWQKGVPRVVTQAYLVAVSIIMAWIVTKLPEVRACV